MVEVVDAIPAWQWIAAAFVFGALWGSFANVVIHRWPREMSIVRPGSHCPECRAPVRFYDNIPIVSYLVLRGRCRRCRARISPRYAVVELAMALLAVGVVRMTLLAAPPTFQQGLAEFFLWFAFAWALLTAGLIDLEHYLLPDAITLPGIVVGLVANAFVLDLGWKEPLIAAAGGFAVIRLLFVDGYELLTGKPGMGAGDAKLVAMLGAFLGVRGAVFALFAGAIQGVVVGGVMVALRRRRGPEAEPVFEEEVDEKTGEAPPPDARFRKARVPFGPFLALGALEYLFVGPVLVDLYSSGVERLLGIG